MANEEIGPKERMDAMFARLKRAGFVNPDFDDALYGWLSDDDD